MNEIEATVQEIISETGRDLSQAIPVLQKLQGKFGYLPMEALEKVCELTDINPSQLYGVATFYSQFRLKPVGEHIIKVCHGTACHVGGADTLTETLESEFGVNDGETTSDMKFTLESVACVGCCSLAPVVVVGDDTYGKLNAKKLLNIIDKI
ncbi:MAG: NADH-quinone oxidoreductase subunit NuoE [Deltaproteobacteria bacterium]|jgi:NADH:ubiquinone oxidoreductase subunit E|nr:NADH-quinone oxidoreductase subunit NuoE [Deltaproteobacteria bacterium]